MGDGPLFISDILPEHVRFVRGVARSLLDEHEAEDAVQETLMRALEQPPDPGNLRGWLRVVVRNFALRRKREEKRRKRREMPRLRRKASRRPRRAWRGSRGNSVSSRRCAASPIPIAR